MKASELARLLLGWVSNGEDFEVGTYDAESDTFCGITTLVTRSTEQSGSALVSDDEELGKRFIGVGNEFIKSNISRECDHEKRARIAAGGYG